MTVNKYKINMARSVISLVFILFIYATWLSHGTDIKNNIKLSGSAKLPAEMDKAIPSLAHNKEHYDSKSYIKKHKPKDIDAGRLIPGPSLSNEERKGINKIKRKDEVQNKNNLDDKNHKKSPSDMKIMFAGLGKEMKDRITCARINLDFKGSVEQAFAALGAVGEHQIDSVDMSRYQVKLAGTTHYFGAMLNCDGKAVKLFLPATVQTKIFDEITKKTHEKLKNDQLALVTTAVVRFNSAGEIEHVEVKTT